MKKEIAILILNILFPFLINAQPFERREQYNIEKDKILYTIGYSHLDTEWNWDYSTTINEYIKNTMTENFHLFEKYPDYVFNFTGSRRYQMMQEYYPDLYEKMKHYIREGQWYVSGSSVDEGEVNISSAESLIRQVLYGNNYFEDEFGVRSVDYMLPDCFGFLANVPTILNHCGLLGFSTQKLTWRSAAGIPFNIGVWNGPDGKGIIASLNATSYVGDIKTRLDLDDSWNKRIKDNHTKYGITFDYRYYGVGDQGGAPRERDVKNAIGSLNNKDSQFKVVLTSSDQMFKDITSTIRNKLPVYTGDLLLIEHSAGSLTSQSFIKRMNRRNEILAQSAEQLASVADWTGKVRYPFEKINRSWNLILGSQMHDILPGTSIPKAYKYAHNDEFIAANSLESVLVNSVTELSGLMDTECKGRSIVVYNPVARDREDVVKVSLKYDKTPANLMVFDGDGNVVSSQIINCQKDSVELLFLAKVPSIGLVSFEVREVRKILSEVSSLEVTRTSLENEFYKVKLDHNGNIQSLFDKLANKELLSQPARLEFLQEKPAEWPAWNMDWKDRQSPPLGYPDESVSMRIVEKGSVRVAIEVKREGRSSLITQRLSLSSGKAGRRLEISNCVDWQSRGVSLKASFPLTVSNKVATYNMEVGTIQRSNNDSLKFEVPSRKWVDLTDTSGDYGVTILEDCKYGSDKPTNNTLRLTLLYTPETKSNYQYQNTQDWGVHSFRYGIYGHLGNFIEGLSSWQGELFNRPLLAFEVPKHTGMWKKEVSFLSVNTPAVGIMALKKMEKGDYYLVRVNELFGKDLKGAEITFNRKILDAYEVNGQEQRIDSIDFIDNKLRCNLSYSAIRSFAVKLDSLTLFSNVATQKSLILKYNQDVISYDSNRNDGSFCNGDSYWRQASIPAEMIPAEIISDGIHFKIGSKEDGNNNAVCCKGQEIILPKGEYSSLFILASADEDTEGNFKIDNQGHQMKIQKWAGFIGQFYNREFAQDGVTVKKIERPYLKKDNIAWYISHHHKAYPSKNLAYQYCYLYKYEIELPEGAHRLVLPDNEKIKVFSITVANGLSRKIKSLQPLIDYFADSQDVTIRN